MKLFVRLLLQLHLLLLGAYQAANALQLPKAPVKVGARATHCDHTLVHSQRPTVIDCGKAVRRLPHDTTEGFFHYDGLIDHFRLPFVAFSGTCGVSVDLRANDDISSWRWISNAAVALKVACMDLTFAQPQVTGGWTTVGAESGIIISLSMAQGLHGAHGSNRTMEMNGLRYSETEAGYAHVLEKG